MARYLTAPSHYLNQCWVTISENLWHSHESNFTVSGQATFRYDEFQNYRIGITATSPRRQWVKSDSIIFPSGGVPSVCTVDWKLNMYFSKFFLIIGDSKSHYSDVTVASQITGISTVCSTVCFRSISKKASKLRVTGFCGGNPPVAGQLPSQRASNAENVSMWGHRDLCLTHGVIQNGGRNLAKSLGTSNINYCQCCTPWRYLIYHVCISGPPRSDRGPVLGWS